MKARRPLDGKTYNGEMPQKFDTRKEQDGKRMGLGFRKLYWMIILDKRHDQGW